MAAPKGDIENKIRDILLADSNFDSLKAAVRGFQYTVPLAWFPFAEVTITSEAEPSEQTGLVIRTYLGAIRFNTSEQEVITLTARKVDVPGYLTVQELVDSCVKLFGQRVNRDLAGLTGASWAVRRFIIGGNIEYGIDSRTARQNSFQNYGVVSFSCEIQEAKT